jgi:hypothetical protein
MLRRLGSQIKRKSGVDQAKATFNLLESVIDPIEPRAVVSQRVLDPDPPGISDP